MGSLAFRADCLALLLTVAAVSARATDLIYANDFELDAGTGPTQTCTVSPDASGFFTLTSAVSDYVVRLPPGYDSLNPVPQRLLVAIHGCGDTALNFASWAAVPYGLRASQNYIAISVGGREGDCFNTSSDAAIVSAAIEHVRSCFYVHRRRIVLGGYSVGGELAYKMAMAHGQIYAGVLIENSSLSQAVGGVGNVDAALDAAIWPLNVGHSARISDTVYSIAGVRVDHNKLIAHEFPVEYRELDGTHDGNSEDWALYLIPLMANWASP